MRGAFAVLCVVGVLGLSGCGGGSSTWEATSSGPDDRSPTPAGDLESCLVGTWEMDVSFQGSLLTESVNDIDDESSFDDVDFSAIQTHTLSDDGTYTAEIQVEMTTTGTIDGQTLPMSSSGTGTASGTWSVRSGRLAATVTSTSGTGTVTRGETTIDMPNPSSLGSLVLIPTDPYPVTCTDSAMTIDVDLSPVIPGAPDQLVATRR